MTYLHASRYMPAPAVHPMLVGWKANQQWIIVELMFGLGPDWIEITLPSRVDRVDVGLRGKEQDWENRHTDALEEMAIKVMQRREFDDDSMQKAREMLWAELVDINEQIEAEDRQWAEEDRALDFYYRIGRSLR